MTLLSLIQELPIEVHVWSREFYNQTTIHWLALSAVLVLGSLTLLLPRRLALFPFLALTCLIPTAQRIVVFGLDFTLLRIMILCSCCRILMRAEYRGVRLQRTDTLMVAWVCSTSLGYTVTRGSVSDAIYISGVSFDALGLYFIFRCMIRQMVDLKRFVLGLVIISLPVAAAFINEKVTGYNIFSIFGGVHEFTVVREGKLRCMGAYDHAILAGCYWASVIPVMGSTLYGLGAQKALGVLGVTCGVIIVFMSASSTPLAGIVVGIVGMYFLRHRYRMRQLRAFAVISTIVIHFAREKPVWHLISRIDLVGGSTGYHRYVLIDQFIRRVGEWGLTGTRGTAHWGAGLFDVTNMYVKQGVFGGLVTLVLFLAIIVSACARVGWNWRYYERNLENRALTWSLGVALLVHCSQFLGVTYTGQINFLWFFTIAATVSVSEWTGMPSSSVAVGNRHRAAVHGARLAAHGSRARARATT